MIVIESKRKKPATILLRLTSFGNNPALLRNNPSLSGGKGRVCSGIIGDAVLLDHMLAAYSAPLSS